ncbi:regucalcin [Folsomia candida]|uniref:Regucalcin n=1 Tax=Folsomia candida TaxID=158441 RepID=A0A226DLD5_FOLCA|nr:regucalcin [Folsomia candida]OXA46355.1 Regucalcin [Folsomia candida]
MNPYVQVVNTCLLGEAPHWSERTQSLYYVDTEGTAVHRYDPVTRDHTKATIAGLGSVSLIVPVAGEVDKYVITTGRELQVLEWDGKDDRPLSLEPILSVDEPFPNNSFNDGKCDAMGRLWAGSVNPFALPNASLYKVDHGIGTTMESDIRISNGIAWSNDNTLMFYIDTATRRVDVFDFDETDGTISNRRTVYNFNTVGELGSPDGMTTDVNGHLYVACFGGSQVIKIDPEQGTKIGSIRFPTFNITSVMFGGANLDTLFVTSAQSGLSQPILVSQPMAGATFQVTNLSARGHSANEYNL